MKEYYIVILNWNGWEDTKNCVESILKESASNNYNIILIDNGSKVEEIQKIDEYCSSQFNYVISNDKEFYLSPNVILPTDFTTKPSNEKIIVIKNNENLGFANGNNVALKFLQNIEQDYAILLNNDTEIEDDALGKMFNFLIGNEQKNIVAVVPQIRYYDPGDIIWNCGGSINWLGVRKYHYAFKNIKKVPQKGSKQVDYGTGCAFLMKLSNTGILSEKFFFGEEDMEMAFRLRKRNLKINCLFDAVIYHKVGASRVKISQEKMGNMVYHYSMRMSNLKEYLPIPLWYVSFFAHYLSTVKILRQEDFFSLIKVNQMWRDVYKNVRDIKRFEKKDYLTMSRKTY